MFADAARRADKPALIDGLSGRAISYGQLVERARLVAGGLAARLPAGRGVRHLLPQPARVRGRVLRRAAGRGTNTTVNPLYTVEELAAQLRDAGASYLSVADLGEEETGVAVLPFFHAYGQVVLMAAALWQGATLVTMPRFDLSALRFVLSGAAPLSAELEQACARRLDCMVGQGHGLTETSPILTAHPSDEARIRHGSAGQLMPNTQAKVLDLATGEALGGTQDGELCFRGPRSWPATCTTPRRPPRWSIPTGGCTPATSAMWMRTATSMWWTGSRS